MPITQERMLNILREAGDLESWANELRADLQGIIAAPMSEEAKIEALAAMLEVKPPACVQCAVERAHFRKAQRRNEKSAARMRYKRTAEESSHGLGK